MSSIKIVAISNRGRFLFKFNAVKLPENINDFNNICHRLEIDGN